jgi:hypothetical protein
MDLNPKKETNSNPLGSLGGLISLPMLKILANKLA